MRKKLNILTIIILICLVFSMPISANIPVGPTREDQQQYTVYPQDYDETASAGTVGDPWAGNCLNDALTAVPNGGTIFMRAGYYDLATILYSETKTYNLIGEGINRTFIIMSMTDPEGIAIETDYCTLKGFTIDADSQTDEYVAPVISLAHCDYVTLEDIEVKNAGWQGITFGDCNHLLFQNLFVHDSIENGIHPGTGEWEGSNRYNTYNNIYAWDNGANGFDDYSTVICGNNTYNNIHCWDNTGIGIAIYHVVGSTLSNSSAIGNGDKGMEFDGIKDFTIDNCFTSLNDVAAILIKGSSENVNLTNVIALNNTTGIQLSDTTDVTLTSCQSYDERVVVGTDIAFVDGGVGADTITQVAALFLVNGFIAGNDITVTGSTSNNVTKAIVSVTAGTITLAAGSLVNEVAGDTVTITHEAVQDTGIEFYATNTGVSLLNCKLSPNVSGETWNQAEGSTYGYSIVNDDIDLIFGNDRNWLVQYDEAVDNQLLWITAGTGCTATTDAMYQIIVGATPTANQQVFGVAKGTQASKTQLFSVDEDGDTDVAGGIRVTTSVGFDAALAGRIYKGAASGMSLQGVTGTSYDFCFFTPAGQYLFVNPTGTNDISLQTTNDGVRHVAIGHVAPTALLHLAAGTTATDTAPLKFTSGTLLTTEEAGAIEFLTDKFYATITTGTVRKEIGIYGTYYAEMYAYENATATVIEEKDIYHAVSGSGIGTGLVNGWTYQAGVKGSIASVANWDGEVGGTVKVTTSAAHNLTTGDIITQHGTTDYNGTFAVTVIDADEYYITETWTETRTGTFARGTCLKAGAGAAGIYRVTMSLTAWTAAAGKLMKFEINQNLTTPDNVVVSHKFATADYTPASSTGLLTIAASDCIWLSVKNETDGSDITIRHANINLSRI